MRLGHSGAGCGMQSPYRNHVVRKRHAGSGGGQSEGGGSRHLGRGVLVLKRPGARAVPRSSAVGTLSQFPIGHGTAEGASVGVQQETLE